MLIHSLKPYLCSVYIGEQTQNRFYKYFLFIFWLFLFQNVLEIRKDVFGEKNLCVAMVHEDLGYASYVQEYSSGEFENAKYDHLYCLAFFHCCLFMLLFKCYLHWPHIEMFICFI
jgi:hypothetical protein